MSTLMYKSGSSWIDVIHPVGSVWLSNSSTSPSSLFGGTWQQLTNAVLRAAAAYGYNGSDNMTLTISNMPSHTHTPSRRVLVYSNEDYGNLSINTVGTRISSYGYILDKGHGSSISNTGSTGGGAIILEIASLLQYLLLGQNWIAAARGCYNGTPLL